MLGGTARAAGRWRRAFFSCAPKLKPGVPFSTSSREMPLGPGPPVRHMTKYTSL